MRRRWRDPLPEYNPNLVKKLPVIRVLDHVPPYIPDGEKPVLGLIGEAPSNMERLKGVPLCGPAGRLLDQLLNTAGIKRAELYIDNVFDEQLPENEIANWCAPAAERKGWEGYDTPGFPGKGFLRPEHLWHFGRLRDTIERVKPKLLIPLGGTSLWAFTGSSGITGARGAVGEATRIVPGYPMLPTFHPEFVRHQFKMFHVVVADLKKAWAIATGNGPALTEHEIWIDPSLDDLWLFKEKYIDKADILSIDIETAGGQIKSFGVGVDHHRALVVPFVDYRNPSHSYWLTANDEVAAIEWVEAVCGTPIPKLFQYGQYDAYWLFDRWGVKTINYSHDTRLAHHAEYPEMPKDLGFMGANYTQNKAWKLMADHKSEGRDQ